jgi:hypothetical protein
MPESKILINFKCGETLAKTIKEHAQNAKLPVSAFIRRVLEMVLIENEGGQS